MTGCRYRVAVLCVLVQLAAFQVGFAEDAEPPPRVIVMVSSVFGSPTPPQADIQVIPNGNFEIIRNVTEEEDPRVKTVGDGIDEFTLWTFDLGTHPHIEAALAETEGKPNYLITEARLTLVVKPMVTSAQTDVIYIQGSACNHTTQKLFNPPGYADLELKKIQVIDYDLIKAGHYRPIGLHNYLKLEHPTENTAQKQSGYAFTVYDKTIPCQLPMLLRDDTIVSQATLVLRFERSGCLAEGVIESEGLEEEADYQVAFQTETYNGHYSVSLSRSCGYKGRPLSVFTNNTIACVAPFLLFPILAPFRPDLWGGRAGNRPGLPDTLPDTHRCARVQN